MGILVKIKYLYDINTAYYPDRSLGLEHQFAHEPAIHSSDMLQRQLFQPSFQDCTEELYAISVNKLNELYKLLCYI